MSNEVEDKIMWEKLIEILPKESVSFCNFAKFRTQNARKTQISSQKKPRKKKQLLLKRQML
jgi:hypothetical protein